LDATNTTIIDFLNKPAVWTIPLYQRTYGWTRNQCEQLWRDIERLAEKGKEESHFIGSVVYLKPGTHLQTMLKPSIVIDGQQRMTTISLILSALGKVMDEKNYSGEMSNEKIKDYFLKNNKEEPEKRYRLILTKSDKETLKRVIDDDKLPSDHSKSIIENYDFFLDKIRKSKMDLGELFNALQRLLMVEISLTEGSDNPQLIFESLNSTGLKLTQTDLVRNYILMGLEPDRQEEIYNKYWYPMEEQFSEMGKGEEFDKFMRYFLNVQTGNERIVKENVYQEFKTYWENKDSINDTIEKIHQFSKYYADLFFGTFENKHISTIAKNIKFLKADVVYPFLLKVIDDQKNGHVTESELIEIFSLVESYVFRRAICDVPTNSMNKTFPVLAREIKKEDYLNSLKFAFHQKTTYKRFPDDTEFKTQFVVKDVYNFNRRSYLLEKLENFDRKELVELDEYTIEHIMPQNPNLSQKWRDDLGDNWEEVQKKYLHTIGNLTLTGYNSELSDRPFEEKKTIKGGFADSPIRLNKTLAGLEKWNEEEIKKRAGELANLALKIWLSPKLEPEILEKYEDKTDNESQPDRFIDEVIGELKEIAEDSGYTFEKVGKRTNQSLYVLKDPNNISDEIRVDFHEANTDYFQVNAGTKFLTENPEAKNYLVLTKDEVESFVCLPYETEQKYSRFVSEGDGTGGWDSTGKGKHSVHNLKINETEAHFEPKDKESVRKDVSEYLNTWNNLSQRFASSKWSVKIDD